jgi:GTP:adenosylcobinamide-phosphate guanylyltransferase
MIVNAILLAGGIMAQDDPLAFEHPQRRRSLIDIHEKPMAQWVLNALSASSQIQNIYISGLSPADGLISSKPTIYLEDQGGMFENIREGVLQSAKDHPELNKVVLASSDIPAIQPHMVDWLMEQVENDPKADLYYNVIARENMENRFHNANRSYVKFKDISVCGGDLNVVDTTLFSVERPIWKKLTEARKHPLKQALILGLGNLALVATHLATLETMVNRISKRLSVNARALICPFPELAMDADKPHQLAILRDALGADL